MRAFALTAPFQTSARALIGFQDPKGHYGDFSRQANFRQSAAKTTYEEATKRYTLKLEEQQSVDHTLLSEIERDHEAALDALREEHSTILSELDRDHLAHVEKRDREHAFALAELKTAQVPKFVFPEVDTSSCIHLQDVYDNYDHGHNNDDDDDAGDKSCV